MAVSAEKRVATSSSIPPPPDSGVRESAGRLEIISPSLSYRISTAADLRARPAEASRSAPATPIVVGTEVSAAVRDVARALLAWRRLPGPRPRVLDACGPELAALGRGSRRLLATLPWRRLALVTIGIFGSVAVLLFAVITVGELTDDVKPGRRTEALARHAPEAVVTPAPLAATTPPSVTASTATGSGFETVEAPATPKPRKKRPKHPGPTGPERFVP